MVQQLLRQKHCHDLQAKGRSLEVGDPVYTQNFGSGPMWIPGVVEQRTGPVPCKVVLGNGKVVRRQIDQVKSRSSSYTSECDAQGGTSQENVAAAEVLTP